MLQDGAHLSAVVDLPVDRSERDIHHGLIYPERIKCNAGRMNADVNDKIEFNIVGGAEGGWTGKPPTFVSLMGNGVYSRVSEATDVATPSSSF